MTVDQVQIPDSMRLALAHEQAVGKRNLDRTAALGAAWQLRKAMITARDPTTRTVTVLLGASDLSDQPVYGIPGVPVQPWVYPRVNDHCWVGFFPVPVVMFSEGAIGACKLRRTTAATITSGGTEPGVAVSLDTEVIDTDGMHDGTNPARLTFGWPGWYDFWGSMDWEPGQTAGFRSCAVRRSGTSGVATLERQRGFQGHAAIQHGQNIAGGRDFLAGDYLELMAYQSSGASVTLATNNEDSPTLGASWKGLAVL